MRTTLNLPDGVLERVAELSGKSRKTDIVLTALREYEAALLRARLLKLRGRSKLLATDFDPGTLRDMENDETCRTR